MLNLAEDILETFAEAATLGGRSLDDREIDARNYERVRCKLAMRDLRERRKPFPIYAERLCAWCKLPFQVIFHERPGRVREYCCIQHKNSAWKWRLKNSASNVLALHST